MLKKLVAITLLIVPCLIESAAMTKLVGGIYTDAIDEGKMTCAQAYEEAENNSKFPVSPLALEPYLPSKCKLDIESKILLPAKFQHLDPKKRKQNANKLGYTEVQLDAIYNTILFATEYETSPKSALQRLPKKVQENFTKIINEASKLKNANEIHSKIEDAYSLVLQYYTKLSKQEFNSNKNSKK